ncbi:ABC transporter permease subunit [Planomonospora sp. ID67723]|uniref:ABC transporter permease subunit n=1 Tax=Planomonospora sp. ID67723 TaxID=2738134 RepID=UPI0018C40879|nr:ABC transporter permease subunit [Planomonospora sp. ID67723]MBG0832013.1 ABC transporter permease subunit [Planomonospora sp. ID67723]
MSTGTGTPYRSSLRTGRDGFIHLLRAEWTKFRTVRGWVLALGAAVLVTVLLGVLLAAGSHTSCSKGPVEAPCPPLPTGPGGEAVEDKFYFVYRPLTGDGSITVRVTSMTGRIRLPDETPGVRNVVPGVVPWAKAGVIVKESGEQGSPYAAVMVTGEHGVRMQHNFTHDTAGRPGKVSGKSPRWLRLTRAGETLTGYESADGVNWAVVGTVRLARLPDTVRIGMFAASPGDLTVTRGGLGGLSAAVRFAEVTAVFDRVGLGGGVPGGAWNRQDVGVTTGFDGSPHHPGGFVESGGTFTVTGVGDVAPRADGSKIELPLTGTMTGLIVVIVVAVTSVTDEYRRGLIRTTLLASPRRGRALAAKAAVIGAVAFAAGLAAAGIVVPLGVRILRAGGNDVLPVAALTELRVIIGTAALFAATAVISLAFGALFRRGVAAVVTAVTVVVLPHILATTSVVPEGLSQWLLRVTPAAGFAVQQSIPEYPQVIGHYAPAAGYYPLAPWAGAAVLCGYAVLALGLAVLLLRRRDA